MRAAQPTTIATLISYLVYKKIDFPYTHNISLLLEMRPPNADWSNDLWR
jgi:hypothetical protein